MIRQIYQTVGLKIILMQKGGYTRPAGKPMYLKELARREGKKVVRVIEINHFSAI